MAQSIAYDYGAINRGLRNLEGKAEPEGFTIPDGTIILISSEIVPPLRFPARIQSAFLLHLSKSQPRMSLIHTRVAEEKKSETIQQMVDALIPFYPSVTRNTNDIYLSLNDCRALVTRLVEMRQFTTSV